MRVVFRSKLGVLWRAILALWRGGLVVSCDPIPGHRFHAAWDEQTLTLTAVREPPPEAQALKT